MARFVAGSRPFDMTAWDLTDFGDGTVTSDGTSTVDVTGAGGQFHYVLTGSGFGDFDGDGFPQSGTVTGFSMGIPDRSQMTITGISMDAATFMSYVEGNDSAGLEATLFAGADSFVGREHDVTLLGYGGADNFNISRGGDDIIQGGDGNDIVNPGAAFTAADSIDGGAGTDKLHLDGDYSAGVTFGAATLTNVETVTLAEGHSYKLIVNATSDTGGQTLAIHANTLLANTTLYADASAVSGTLSLGGGAGNDTLTGGSGSNTIAGGDGNDQLYAGTGINIISGGNGDDTITFTNWNSSDVAKGLAGTDTVVLDGDFSGGITLDNAQFKGVETLKFAAGHDYNITVNSTFAVLNIYAALLDASNSLTFDGSASAGASIIGGAGNDVLLGGTQGSIFSLGAGGNDTAIGGGGTDHFDMGGALTAQDHIDGAGGVNSMLLDGDYSGGLVLGPNTVLNIGHFTLDGGFNYNITTDDATVAAGQTLTVESDINSAANSLVFDGSAETDGNFLFQANGLGTNTLTGGAGNDTFDIALASAAGDFIDGGAGNDTLNLTGHSVSTVVTVGANVLHSVETMNITDGNVRMLDADVAAGQTLNVSVGEYSVFDGSRETDGAFHIEASNATKVTGGDGDDFIQGHGLRGSFKGGLGADTIVGGNNVYYSSVAESTSTEHDILSLVPQEIIHLWFAVSAVDSAVNSGSLSEATFDSDLAAAVGSSQLGSHHAVVFTPNAGGFSGHHFLIVDANGTAGYQAGADLVIDLGNQPVSVSLANFGQ